MLGTMGRHGGRSGCLEGAIKKGGESELSPPVRGEIQPTLHRGEGDVCRLVDDGHVFRSGSLRILHNFERYPLTFFEGAVSLSVDGGEVDEYVPLTVLPLEEPKALFRVEPLDCTFDQEMCLPNRNCRPWACEPKLPQNIDPVQGDFFPFNQVRLFSGSTARCGRSNGVFCGEAIREATVERCPASP